MKGTQLAKKVVISLKKSCKKNDILFRFSHTNALHILGSDRHFELYHEGLLIQMLCATHASVQSINPRIEVDVLENAKSTAQS